VAARAAVAMAADSWVGDAPALQEYTQPEHSTPREQANDACTACAIAMVNTFLTIEKIRERNSFDSWSDPTRSSGGPRGPNAALLSVRRR
jgi:hypothetical protein